MSGTEHEANVSTKQHRIAEVARKYPTQAILSLAHYIDLEWLYVAYLKTRHDGALGIDGQGAEEFAANLKANLGKLLNELKSGLYRAPAVRRVYIPKGAGNETRPLGIPCFADKVLQKAVLMLLTPIWEEEFYDFSYGFREGKSAHQALKALRELSMRELSGGWVIDLDIRKYFDSIDQQLLRDIFSQRVCDGVLKRVIGKWLKAGVMEAGGLSYSETGTPQGGVISPLLSNIYLHEVLDKWFVKEVQPRMKGRSGLIRYADDAVLVFEKAEDAQRVLEVLKKRFQKYKLAVHEEKTQLVKFVKPNKDDENQKPGSFSFLGFTLYWGKSRKGKFIIKWKTAKDRLARSIRNIYQWVRKHRHEKLKEQWQKLRQKMNGHYAYYGLSLNSLALNKFFQQCSRVWFKWLSRRSQKNKLRWERFSSLLEHYPLPRPKIIHSLWSETLT